MKVGLTAIKGNISGVIAKELYRNTLFDLSSALVREGYDEVGMDIGDFLRLDKTGTYITDDIEELVKESDVIVDFSAPELTFKVLDEVVKQRKAMIIGTRLLTMDGIDKIKKLSANCRVMCSNNMSISFNLLLNLVKEASLFLRDEYNINIISSENKKTDMPALIAKNIAEAKGWDNIDISGKYNNSINFSSLVDNNKDEYKISFTTFGEDIEIKQSSINPICIANGVMRALIWLDGKPNGFYKMQDVLMINKK